MPKNFAVFQLILVAVTALALPSNPKFVPMVKPMPLPYSAFISILFTKSIRFDLHSSPAIATVW